MKVVKIKSEGKELPFLDFRGKDKGGGGGEISFCKRYILLCFDDIDMNLTCMFEFRVKTSFCKFALIGYTVF